MFKFQRVRTFAVYAMFYRPRYSLTGQLLQWLVSVRPSVHLFVTSAEEGSYVFGSVCLSVCLSVRRITRKLVNGF